MGGTLNTKKKIICSPTPSKKGLSKSPPPWIRLRILPTCNFSSKRKETTWRDLFWPILCKKITFESEYTENPRAKFIWGLFMSGSTKWYLIFCQHFSVFYSPTKLFQANWIIWDKNNFSAFTIFRVRYFWKLLN